MKNLLKKTILYLKEQVNYHNTTHHNTNEQCNNIIVWISALEHWTHNINVIKLQIQITLYSQELKHTTITLNPLSNKLKFPMW